MVLKRAYWRLDRRLFVRQVRGLSRRERFARIFTTNRWGDAESVSGPGSRVDATEGLRRELPRLLERLGIRTLLDAPCGDANWISQVRLPLREYYGVDIVPEVVELASRRSFPDDGCKRAFSVRDIVSDELPKADLVLCRDTLIHLSNQNVCSALTNFRRTGARYLVANVDLRLRRNRDIEVGNTRPVNLAIEPFRLGLPLEVVADGSDGPSDRGLGLWELHPVPAKASPGRMR